MATSEAQATGSHMSAMYLLVSASSQYTPVGTSAWEDSHQELHLEAGELGMVKAVLSCSAQSNSAARVADGFLLGIRAAAVFVEVKGYGGPVVLVPAVSHDVYVNQNHGLRCVKVTYLPLRAGWATTVQASQGLEFERVLLDLNEAHWLEGGGYTGVGRAKGDLRQSLRIIGGFHGNRAAFAANADARTWFLETVVKSCQ